MKILYYSSHPNLNLENPSGYGRHMREVIKAFRKLGHEVYPLIIGGTSQTSLKGRTGESLIKKIIRGLLPEFIWETVKDYRLIKQDRFFENLLEEAVKDFKPDLIYERGTYLQSSGVKVAMRNNIRHFLELNAPYVEEKQTFSGNSLYRKTAVSIENFLIRNSDKIFVVSTELKNYFVKKYQTNPEKIVVIPNAINPSEINYDTGKVKKLKEKYNLENSFVIGFVGSIFPYHGVDILIRAFKKFGEKHSSSSLFIVGGGESLEELKNLSNDLELHNRVVFAGDVSHSEIYNYIQVMDVTVMAKSNWYGSPVKIFEYAAMGKPVIAPSTGPVREVMSNESDGLIVESSADTVFQALEIVFYDYPKCIENAEKFRSKVLAVHTWDSVAKKILSFY